MKRGRPLDYKPEFAKQAQALCAQFGAIDTDLAKFFNVSERTIYRWKKDHDKFCHALKEGKTLSDARVELALYERAIGYSHPEDKILSNPQKPEEPIIVETMKYYAPDTAACISWLANRNPERWKKDPGGERSSDDLVGTLSELISKLPN